MWLEKEPKEKKSELRDSEENGAKGLKLKPSTPAHFCLSVVFSLSQCELSSVTWNLVGTEYVPSPPTLPSHVLESNPQCDGIRRGLWGGEEVREGRASQMGY